MDHEWRPVGTRLVRYKRIKGSVWHRREYHKKNTNRTGNVSFKGE